MIDKLLASLSVMHILLCIIHQYLISLKDDYELQFTRFSSLAAKRRYTLKSPALAFLKLNMYEQGMNPGKIHAEPASQKSFANQWCRMPT